MEDLRFCRIGKEMARRRTGRRTCHICRTCVPVNPEGNGKEKDQDGSKRN